MAEIALETLRFALEATRGTAIAAPTHLLNLEGTMTPRRTKVRPREQRGTFASHYRSADVRRFVEWEAEGELDSAIAPFLLNMAVAPVTTPTTPTNAVATRLWTFIRNISADDIKSATGYWGDPALTQLKSPFVMLDELVIENDASSEDLATISLKGMGADYSRVAAPTATTSIAGATMPGMLMQCWIDSGSAIGTTAISGRLLSAKHTIRTGVKYKYVAGGPASNLSYSLIGREKFSACTTELTLELIDLTQYDLWEAATSLKVRVRHNGAFIETQTATDFYNYVEVDGYGPASDIEWGDNEGTNRTMTMTIEHQVDSTLGSDLRVAVQNIRTTL